MIELDIFIVDVPTHDRALLGVCIPDSLRSEDVKRAVTERIGWALRESAGLLHTSPILLSESPHKLVYSVIWRELDSPIQYDLYEVDVSIDDESDEAVTEVLELPMRENTMVGTMLKWMQPTFRDQRASQRVRKILRSEE